MKKHLLKTLLTALVLLTGWGSSAWAKSDEITVTYDFTSYAARTLSNSGTRAFNANSVDHNYASNLPEVYNRFAFQFAGTFSIENAGLYAQRSKGDHVGIVGLAAGDKVTINFSQGAIMIRGAVPAWAGNTSDWTSYTTGTEITTSVAGNLSFQAKTSCKISSIVIKTTAAETVTAPIISSEANGSGRLVTLTDGESSLKSGVTTYYTTDGTAPTTSSTKYVEPFVITETTTIKAITISNSSAATSSTVSTEVIDMDAIDVPTAAITAVDGISRTVSFSCATEGVTLYYSTDNGENYTEGTSLVISANTNIKVKATKGSASSESENLEFEAGTTVLLNAPTYSIGAYSDGGYSLTLSSDQSSTLLTPEATISYTIDDGAEISVSSGTAVQVPVDSEIKLWSVYSGYTNSAVVTATPTYINLDDYDVTWSTDFKSLAAEIQPNANSAATLTLGTEELVTGYYNITNTGFNENFGVNNVAWQVRNQGSGKDYNTGLWPYNVNGTMAITNLSAGAVVVFTSDQAVTAKENATKDVFMSTANNNYTFVVNNEGTAEFSATKSSYIYSVVVYETIPPLSVATPTFSVPAGEYSEAQTVTLACETEGAAIYYTIDGTEPTAESTPYSEDFSIGETTTVKAIAVLGDVVSKVAEATYTIAVPFEPVDCTAKVPTDGWQSDQGTVGNFTKDVAQKEQYLTNTTTTEGNVLYQTVTGLDNGTYTVELYANASYTSGRGFASDALNGEVGRVVVFAGDVEMTIPVIHQAGVGTNNIVELKNVVVTDGTLTMGLKKITPGSNWHTIQIKSLTMTSNKAEADANAQNTYWKDVASTIAAYDAYSNVGGSEKSNLVNAETKADVLSSIPVFYAAKTAYNAAKLIADDADGANVDFTSLIVNPSFESGDANGWNYRDTGDRGAKSTSNDTYKMSNSHGNYLFNIWDNFTGYTISQTIASLPSGRYKLQAVVATDANYKMQLKANDNIVQVDATGAGNGLEAEVEFNLFDGVLNISADATDNHWYKVDNFRLIFVKAVTLADCVTDYQAALEEANAKKLSPMNATTKGSLEGVINENSDVDQADINALDAATTALRQAITTADASIAAYADAKAALDAMKAVMDGTNVYTAEAYTTYNGVYTANLEKYNAGTLTDDEAKAIVNPSIAIAWGDRSNAKYGDAATFLLSDWEVSFPDFGSGYYINTWSVEGDTDGSDFKVPFFEYFIGESNSLGEKTLTATVSDVENGQYKVTAWVRVETKSGVGATDADGITLTVNDGDGTDVTQGTQIGETLLSHATYEALGLVKDGVLAINFNVAAGNNIHWLSFKNVKYEKVRDLTEEEMAVNPTDIGLDKTEATLTATDNTVTLTPMFTPENATETVTWTSSDESVATVADGVVTGVAPGTATITVTSTLDENVSASCEVTVSYPETEYELSNYTNDGATRTINALSENNLIKNGSFEYPDGFYGWTDATSSAQKLSSSNFEIVTAEDNHYLKAKGHDGSTSAKSIGTAWPIENGKTYVFGYKVKSNSAGNSEFHKVSLTNTPGTETKQISVNATAVGTGWTDVNYTFTNSENYKYVQLRARWLNSAVCFDDFYLAEATYSLVGNVDYATAAIPTSNIGTGAFQYSQDAINAVNGLVQGEATVADVEAAYDAVTTLNAPAADKLYNVVNISNSYAYKDNALTFKSSKEADLEGNTTAMGWTEKPGSIYPQAIKFTPVEDVKNGYTMSYTRADGNVVYVSTGKTSGLGSNTQQIRPTTEANKALTFVVNSTGENSWTLFNTEDGHSVGASNDAGFYTAGGSNKDVRIQEAVNNEMALEILADNQYCTLIIPFDAAVPTGVTAYSVNEANGNELQLQEVANLKANTPYIFFADKGVNEELAGLGAAYTEKSYTDGWLTGVYEDTPVTAGMYVLQNQKGTVAFYMVGEESTTPDVPAYHAYMTIPSGSEARAYYFGGNATAISALQTLTSGDAEIYDVNGRKQVKLQKGVNIIRTKDGRTQKVMVK